MKRFLFGALVAASLLASSCKKDDNGPTGNDNNNNNNNSSGRMTASINGANWSAMVAEAYIDRELDDITLYGINVKDVNAKTAKSIQIYLEDYHGTGTYELDDTDDEAYMLDVLNGSVTSYGLLVDETSGIGGTVVITEATNKKVKGTFSFTAETVMGDKQVTIANGSFELPLIDD